MLTIETVAIAGGTLLLLLAMLVLVLALGLRGAIAELRAERRVAGERLLEELRTNSPARAAIAAVIASRGEERPTATEFRKEVEALLAQWPQVEALADRAAEEIAAILDEERETADAPRTTAPSARRRRRRRGA